MGTVVQPAGRPGAGPVVAQGAEAPAYASRQSNLLVTAGRILLSILKWLLIAVLALFSAALIVVSLVWGPTHWALALVLVAMWGLVLGLFALAPGRIGRGWTQVAVAAGFLLVGLFTIVVSQASSYTPAIVDAQGKPVPGSIASLEKVRLNGTDQWLSIRGASTDNPVLLWLAGGPGGSQISTVRYHLGALEERFVVVNWEQPGAGKSYHAVPHSDLTTERYISDGLALVRYLRERFGEDKVYLVGESWGSALGVWMVQREPGMFHALVGTGQMVDFLETELADYRWALQQAEARGDTKKVADLKAQGPPPYSDGAVMKQATYLLDGFAYMNSNPAINSDGWDTFQDLLSPDYGLYDKVNWARGVLDSGNVIFPQLWAADVDLRQEAQRLQVPVYFLIGRHDVNAPPALTEEYYALLDAPRKELIWFERSGHNPWVTEADRFADVVVNRVLAENR
ncbi:MAG TPA: alpha/beta hydrolase [Chloroflexia bacterium]|nr:alpha/beta hydrolase [Chloroflexia bacterium]